MSQDQQSQQSPTKKKILFIEDAIDLVFIYTQKFSSEGFEVNSAYNGEDGLIKAKEFRPDLIMLDIMLPKISGLEVLERLKSDEETKDIPVVLLTNLSDDVTIKKGFEKKAEGYIIKASETPDQVLNEAKNILNQYERNRSAT